MKRRKQDAKNMKPQSNVSAVRATISFPSDIYATLEEIAKQKKVSMAWVVRDAARAVHCWRREEVMVKTGSSTETLSERLNIALKLPNGARFYRCALQVNPFAYLTRHKKQTTFQSEREYNAAIVDACLESGIEVIGVTDHYRVDESKGLVKAARAAGLFAFGGFEAVTKDGVHFLCLFDPDRDGCV